MKKINITQHILVPKHTILTSKEKEQLLKDYNISLLELPKIRKKDPAIAHLNAKTGDVVKIIRSSLTAGESIFYRGVV
jgi:DNA-directed RNA polymerase subunit H